MSLSLEPPHTEGRHIQHRGEKAAKKHDPSSCQSEGFAVVEGKEPGDKGFALREGSPVL